MGTLKTGASTYNPSSSGTAALNALLPQVQDVLNPNTNPYHPVMLQTAAQNPTQLAAVGQYSTAFGAANTGLGTYDEAQSLAEGAAQPLTQDEINQYFNPYVNQVVDATQRQFATMNAQQQSANDATAAQQNALGGNRVGVQHALTAGQQALQEDPIIAGMLQAGYTQQEAMAAQQYQQIPLAAASALQQIGAGREAGAGNIANLALGQYGLGTQQQQYNTGAQAGTLGASTAQDLALFQEQMARWGYPIQAVNMASQDIGALAGAYGGTTTTTPPPPSIFSGLTGAGLTGAALYGSGALGALGSMLPFSDRRLKEDIKAVGKTKGGQTIYRFRFKGHPQWHLGLMAQDVEKKHPEAVGQIGGFKTVDVKKATDAARFAGGRVQGLQTGGVPMMPYGANPMSGLGPMPYAGGSSYIPQVGPINIPKLPVAAPMAAPQDDSSNMFMNALNISKLGTKNADTNADAMQDFRMDTLGMSEASGGRVSRAYGGLAMPSSNRINVPMRGGFGMPSFMARARGGGLAEGGDPEVMGEAVPSVIAQGPTPQTGPTLQDKMDDIESDYNLPDGYLSKTARIESSMNPNAHNELSGADGLFQFIPSTARQYGLSNTRDPMASTDAAARLGRDNQAELAKALGRAPTAGELYLAHQQGAAGAIRLLTNPSAPAGSVVPAANISANGGNPNAPASQFVAKWAGKLDNEGGDTQALALAQPEGLATTPPDSGIPGVTPVKAPDLAGKTKPNKDDIWMSLLAAGLGMMGSRSPYAGVGIGQGGLQGVQTYEALHKQRVGEAEHQATLEMNAAALNQHPEMQRQLFAQQKELLEQKEAFDLRKPQLVTLPNGRQMMVQSYPDASQPGGFGFRTIDPRKIPGGQPGKTPSAETKLPAGTNPETGIDPKTGRDERYLAEEVDPEDQKMVKALVDLRKDPASMSFKQRTEYQRMGMAYDPNWHEENYKNLVKTEQEFNSTSPSKGGGQIRAFNNSVQHLNTLDGIIDAMNNGDVKAFTRLRNAYNEQVGQNIMPSEMEAARDIVGKEVVKSIIPGGGGEREREEVASRLAADRSPATLKAVTKTYRELAGAQLRDLRVQFEDGTYGKRQGDFEKKLIPESQRELERAYARTVARPSGLPAGSSYNYKTGQFKTPDGRILDADGNEVK